MSRFSVTTDFEKDHIIAKIDEQEAIMSKDEADRLAFMLNSAIKDLEEEATPKQ